MSICAGAAFLCLLVPPHGGMCQTPANFHMPGHVDAALAAVLNPTSHVLAMRDDWTFGGARRSGLVPLAACPKTAEEARRAWLASRQWRPAPPRQPVPKRWAPAAALKTLPESAGNASLAG